MLFALGLGDRVVGVSSYCDYPPAVHAIPKVGGYYDPNYEAIVALEPDLTILLTSHREIKTELDQLGIRTLTTPHETVQDVHEAIRLIGSTCGAESAADSISRAIAARSQIARRAVEGGERPRVLVCIGRDTESGQLAGMYMAGRDGFYDELIRLAGGVNAYEDETVAYPQLSAEGVLQLNPDILIDLVGDTVSGTKSADEIKGQWQQLPMLSAVRNNRVHLVVGYHALRPGPRYIEFLEQLAALLHPDAFLESAARD